MSSQPRTALPNIVWSKSSYSTGTGNCVELASVSREVLVRDSKNPRSGILALERGAWQAFLRALA